MTFLNSFTYTKVFYIYIVAIKKHLQCGLGPKINDTKHQTGLLFIYLLYNTFEFAEIFISKLKKYTVF